MKRSILATLVAITLGIASCIGQTRPTSVEQGGKSIVQQTTEDMNSFISIFEIPVTDMPRAVNFYQSILDITIEVFEMSGLEIGTFPSNGQSVVGVLMKDKDNLPSANGVTIYLSGGEDLQEALDKVGKSGGTVIMPKTAHADESGFFALLLDTEGNRIGLHSPK